MFADAGYKDCSIQHYMSQHVGNMSAATRKSQLARQQDPTTHSDARKRQVRDVS